MRGPILTAVTGDNPDRPGQRAADRP